MKIAMDISIIEACRTGTEEYVEGLVWGLSRLGTGVVGMGRPGQALLPNQPCMGMATHQKRPLWQKLWWENFGINRALHDVSILHIPYMMYPPRTLSMPTVVTVHDVIPYRLQTYHGRLRERLYFGHISRHLPQATSIVAISEATARDIGEIFPALSPRVRVIPNGVHPDFFQSVAVEEMETLSSHFHLVRRPRLLYVGGYDTRKNVPTILRACREVFSRISDGELVLVGALHYPDVVHLVDELGLRERVVLTPFLSRREVVGFYRASDLFVFPSTYEGFGLPPAQALAAGIPVVAGDTPAVREVVADCGILVPPLDVGAWVEMVTKVLGTPALAQKMAQCGKARAKNFNWEVIAQHYQQLYESLVR